MLLQAAHNYLERGLVCYLLTAKLDTRSGVGRIGSRIGLEKEADTFEANDDLFTRLAERAAAEKLSCIFVDEAQFLTKEQVWQLARFVDEYNLPIMCYGLRVDAFGELFPGSASLLALADEIREVRTICWCGKKAGMVVRRGPDGKAVTSGEQVQVGGNDVYVSLCRKHFREEMGDTPPDTSGIKQMPRAALSRDGIAMPPGSRECVKRKAAEPDTPAAADGSPAPPESVGAPLKPPRLASLASEGDDMAVESPK